LKYSCFPQVYAASGLTLMHLNPLATLLMACQPYFAPDIYDWDGGKKLRPTAGNPCGLIIGLKDRSDLPA